MRKISKANRKFYKKWLPFNFCDRYCERCEEMKKECKLYQDDVQFKMECIREGKDPNDWKVAFEHIAKTMAETMRMVMENLEREGVKLTKEDEDEYYREEDKKDKVIKKHSLYKNCSNLSFKLHKFISDFNPANLKEPLNWAADFWKTEMEEIYFYSHLIHVKAARSLHSKIEDTDRLIKFSRPDYLVSGALGYYSLVTVEKSLINIKEFIKNGEPIWAMKIYTILRQIDKTKKIFAKTFPEIKSYRGKIIFHGKI